MSDIDGLLNDLGTRLLAGENCAQALLDALDDDTAPHRDVLRLSRAVFRTGALADLRPRLQAALMRYPKSLDLAALLAQTEARLGTGDTGLTRFVELTRTSGKRRSIAACYLDECGKRDQALALLDAPGGDADHAASDAMARLDITSAGGAMKEGIEDLHRTYPQDTDVTQRLLSSVCQHDGPAAMTRLFATLHPTKDLALHVFEALLSARHFTGAQGIFARHLDTNAEVPKLRDAYCRLLLASSRPDLAEGWFLPRLTEPLHMQTSRSLRLRVRCALASFDHVAALNRSDEGMRLYPNDPGLARLYVEAQFRLGNWDAAAAYLEEAQTRAPGRQDIADLRRGFAIRQGMIATPATVGEALAQGDIEAATRLIPVGDGVMPKIAHLSADMQIGVAQGRLSDAMAAASALEECDPHRADIRVDTARVRFLAGDIDGARQARAAFAALKDGKIEGARLSSRRDVTDLVLQDADPADPCWQIFASDMPFTAQITAAKDNLPDTVAAATAFIYRWIHAEQTPFAPSDAGVRIPQHLVTYWEGDSSPPLTMIREEWSAVINDLPPAHFNADAATAWLVNNSEAAVLQRFRRATNPAERSDIFRVAYLLQNGGIYVDLDERPRQSIEDWLKGADIVLVHERGHSSIANNFIATVPGHPILRAALDEMVAQSIGANGVETWMRTGPGLFAKVTGRWLRAQHIRSSDCGALRLLLQQDYETRVATNLKLPHKYNADYWRRLD